MNAKKNSWFFLMTQSIDHIRKSQCRLPSQIILRYSAEISGELPSVRRPINIIPVKYLHVTIERNVSSVLSARIDREPGLFLVMTSRNSLRSHKSLWCWDYWKQIHCSVHSQHSPFLCPVTSAVPWSLSTLLHLWGRERENMKIKIKILLLRFWE